MELAEPAMYVLHNSNNHNSILTCSHSGTALVVVTIPVVAPGVDGAATQVITAGPAISLPTIRPRPQSLQ
jgi:hypothetical protein